MSAEGIEPVGFDYRTAAPYAGVSERTLRDEVAAGRLKVFRPGRKAGAVRFHKKDLDAWLDMLREEEAQRQDKRRKRRTREPAVA